MLPPLLIPAFIAGGLTLFAPCTLPLIIPALLALICGTALSAPAPIRSKILVNSFFFMLGFGMLFIITGTAIGFVGGAILGVYRLVLFRAGGVLIFLFGAVMVSERIPTNRFSFFSGKLPAHPLIRILLPSKPVSAIILGGIFALGWTPCVGPVLGSALTLAATRATAIKGSILLASFSFGLAVPFLLLAAFLDSAARFTTRAVPLIRLTPLVAGILLMGLGLLIATNNFDIWFALAQQLIGNTDTTPFRAYL